MTLRQMMTSKMIAREDDYKVAKHLVSSSKNNFINIKLAFI